MATLKKEYDVIMVGGGINGLACAAYLQKSGLKVAVFERRAECGTQCCSEELMHPGVRVNLCANLMMCMHSPAYDELELERFGLEMLPTGEWALFYPIKRDKSAVLHHAYDARRTYHQWQSLNEHDAEVFRKLTKFIAPRMQEFYQEIWFKPLTMEASMKLVNDLKKCPDLPSNLATMSPGELADGLFQDERIKAAWLALGIEYDVYPFQAGLAITSLMMGPITQHMVIQSNLARGGPHAITHALARCFVHYGGSIFTNCPVTKINIESGEARGVVLSKDAVYPEAEIRATKAVISDLTMHPTFIDLVGLEHLPQYADAIKSFTYDAPVQFTAYWALNEPLDWSGAGFPKELDRAYGFNYGIDNWKDDITRAEKDWANHRPPNPPIACGLTVQSYCFVDPTQAPKGQYTVMSWAEACYDLDDYPNGGLAWDDIREDYGDKVEDLLASYVPNIKKAKVARYCESPLGYYRRNPSQIKGHWVGAKIPSQTGLNAPFPGCGAPRSPIAKLYLVRYQGTCTTLDAGYRVADILTQDLGIRDKQDWWNVKPFEPQARWLQRHGIDNRWTVD